jgi:two-component system sensor histidine kinase/response regulator
LNLPDKKIELEKEPTPGVLIIDDEEIMREGCRQILLTNGYEINAAESARTGLELVRSASPDIVLLDIRMPGMNGLETIEHILEIDPRIIIIMITGYATIDYAVESIKNGAFDFLAKPFTPDDLRLTVGRGLEKRQLSIETEKLREEKKRLTDYFISIVSHQLRTPVAAVCQYIEVLLGNYVGGIPGEAKQILQRANFRLTELMEMIEDWLTITKFDPKTILKEARQLDMKKIIDSQIEFLKPLISEKGIRIDLNCSPGQPKFIGNKRLIEEAVSNLVSNAIKYNRNSGKLTIDVSFDDDKYYISFADTGIGIPADQLPFICNEFYRVKNDFTRDIPGTGLGLTIVKKFVEVHGGSIEIESKEEKGSTFTITLPLKPQPDEANAAEFESGNTISAGKSFKKGDFYGR